MRLTDSMVALVTLFAGGVLTQAGAFAQRRWRRADEALAYERDLAARERATRAARMEAAYEQMLDAAARVRLALGPVTDDDSIPDLGEEAELIYKAVALVPDRLLRDRIENDIGIMTWADEVASQVPYPPQQIAWWAANDITETAGALLRDESPEPPKEWHQEWLATYQRLAGSEAPLRFDDVADPV